MKRELGPEILDGSDYTSLELDQTLRQLARINRLTNTHAATFKAFKTMADAVPERPLRVLEIGFGFGDALRALASYAEAQGIEAVFEGLELSAQVTKIASQELPQFKNIKYLTGNVLDLPADQKFHFITNTQMMHHLDDAAIIQILKWMTAHSTHSWFINDLHRHPFSYWIFVPLMKTLGFNRIILADGKLSIAKSFTREDWKNYITEAEIELSSVKIKRHWPFRFGVTYLKGSPV